MPVSRLTTLALGAALALGGVAVGRLLAPEPARTVRRAEPRREPCAELHRRIEDLRAELLARLDGAGQDLRPAPEPELQPPAERAGTRTPVEGATNLEPLLERLTALEEAVDHLRDGLVSADGPVRVPSVELLRSTPSEPKWDAVASLLAALETHGEAARAAEDRLKWASQEDVLRTYGRPTTIFDDGRWLYSGKDVPAVGGSVVFRFVGGFVVGVH